MRQPAIDITKNVSINNSKYYYQVIPFFRLFFLFSVFVFYFVSAWACTRTGTRRSICFGYTDGS